MLILQLTYLGVECCDAKMNIIHQLSKNKVIFFLFLVSHLYPRTVDFYTYDVTILTRKDLGNIIR